MNKLISSIITFSLANRKLTIFWVILMCGIGVVSYINTPIEAFPETTNNQIIIVTQWPGRSAEEVEKFVSIPIELSLNPVQNKASVRSITMFGLSVIKIVFEDNVDDFTARQQVNNQLQTLNLPENANPEIQPPYGPTGEIFRYYLKSKNHDSRELLTIQNWTIDKALRGVPGVADIVAFGGQEKIYEIQVIPNLLSTYNITPLDVYKAVNNSNINVGGDIIEKNSQAYVVRGIGLLQKKEDIENIIIDNVGDVPILVKHVAEIKESSLPRVGQAGINADNDIVEGIVVMRKGENPSEVLGRVKTKIKELNESTLPLGVSIEPFYDRDNLMHFCTETVIHNLTEGIVFVTLIVLLFMVDWRTTVIVSIIIPLSLLFAFICLRMKGMSANLLSLGAVDFGIIIDGAVVMVEGLFVSLDHLAHKKGMDKFNKLLKLGLIKKAASETGKAVFFSKLIIITALLPIFAFQKVEGKMFSPLAYTLGFALLGALLFTLTLVPVLVSMLLNKNVKEKQLGVITFISNKIHSFFTWCFQHKKTSFITATIIFVLSVASGGLLGSEFLPQLNEGALWITAELPMSTSLSESVHMAEKLRKDISTFPEVSNVLSQTGRSNDGTDPNGFYFLQFQVDLKPKADWKRKITYDDLIEDINKKLTRHQGIMYNYSQPVIDNVAEAVAGFKASNAVKIYGNDLKTLDALSVEVLEQIKNIDGIKEAGILRNIGQPELQIILNNNKMSLYGINTADAQSVIEMAIGGKTANIMYEGERKFNIRIRFAEEYRKTESDIENLMVPTLRGNKIPLKEIAIIKTITGPAFIYRDNNKRFIGIKFSIRGRDLGSTIAEAQQKIEKNVELPAGYSTSWTGEFENQIRATSRLNQVAPFSLIGIFVLLFIMFSNGKDALLVLANVPFALVGGIIALHVTGINFGISAGVGFIALLGICVQNGVILVSEFKNNLKEKYSIIEAIDLGIKSRIRPILMTAMMASIGLMPAALSTGIGSESQKPLAIVIIGGLITATLFTILIFPIVYWVYNNKLKGTFMEELGSNEKID
ncbi:MAG: hypothetical protein RLZZ175_2379 [Bacteroidota bacterium]|jgi:cobalt-zinc-cadmium resistance protein CzcA